MHRESKRIAPYEVSGRKLDRKARRSGIALTTPPGGQVVERSKPRPDVAFLVICSVKLLVEAMPPGSLEH